MQFPAIPENETARLESLRELELLDAEHQETFQNAAQLAARIFGSRSALVSLVDSDRQWFAAKFNFELSGGERNMSFCGHVVASGKTMVVPDARLDPRFHDNPLVLEQPKVVFYAGAPLTTPDNLTLGTLCVLDDKPGTATDEQIRALEDLAELVIQDMENRRNALRKRTDVALAQQQQQTASPSFGRHLRRLGAALSRLLMPSKAGGPTEAHAHDPSGMNTLKISATDRHDTPQPIDPETFFKTAPKLTSVAPYAVALDTLSSLGSVASVHGVELTITASPEDEAMLVETDGDRLRAILVNSLTGTLQKVTNGSLNIQFESNAETSTIDFKINARGNIESQSSLASLLTIAGNSDSNANLKLLESIAGQLQSRDIAGQTTESLSYRITLPMTFSASDTL